jgi:hypothetical protein
MKKKLNGKQKKIRKIGIRIKKIIRKNRESI